MKMSKALKNLMITAVAGFALSACALFAEQEPEKDPIFDVTPGGQGQQGQQNRQ